MLKPCEKEEHTKLQLGVENRMTITSKYGYADNFTK